MRSIVLFGDSVFFGIGASSRDKGCGKLLKKLTDLPVIIKSRSLDTSADGLARLDKDVLEQDDILFVIIMFGNNDCRLNEKDIPNVSPQEYKHNLKTMIQKIKFTSKIPLLSNLQPISSEGFFSLFPAMRSLVSIYSQPNTWQKKYSKICNKLSAEENIALVDIRLPLEKNIDSILAEDELHPNDLGHSIIAQELAKALGKVKNGIKCF